MSGITMDAVIRDARRLRIGRDITSRSTLGAILPLHDVRYHVSAGSLAACRRTRIEFLCERTRSTAWWSQTGSNRRPHACKARALPTELWPHFRKRRAAKSKRWWAWEDLNFRPHAYQARALTN